MTLRRRINPEELCCDLPVTGGSARAAKQRDITHWGMRCLHVKQRIELGEVGSAASRGRMKEEMKLLQSVFSAVIKAVGWIISFLPEKKGTCLPSRRPEPNDA